MLATLWKNTTDFLHAPFQRPVDVWTLFWVTGLVIVFAIVWSRVIVHVTETVIEEV